MTSIHSIEHTFTLLHYEDYYLLYYGKRATRANEPGKNVY